MNTPLVPDYRLIEIIKGYVADHSDEVSRPDMNFESRLLALAQIIVDEAKARLPLWELERKWELEIKIKNGQL